MIRTSAAAYRSPRLFLALHLLAILLLFLGPAFSQVALVTGPNGLDLQQNALLIEVANSSTLPVANELVILTGAPSQATQALTTSTTGVVGICLVNCNVSGGTAVIATAGVAACIFDNATTAGDYVQASNSANGKCDDTTSTTYPTNGRQVIGRVLSSNSLSSTPRNIIIYAAETTPPALLASAAGGTVFGNNTSSTAAPAFTAAPVLGIPGTTPGTLGFAGATSGTTTVQSNATAAGTTTLNTATGTSPVTLSAKLGSSDTVNCTNAETDFTTTYTLAASFLTANRVVRVTWLGRESSSATPNNVGFNLKIGTTNVYSAATVTPGVSLSNVPLGITFYIQGTAAAGASVNVFTNPVGPPTAVSSPFSKSSINQPVALATNGTLTITPGWACNGNTAGNSATTDQLIVEALN